MRPRLPLLLLLTACTSTPELSLDGGARADRSDPGDAGAPGDAQAELDGGGEADALPGPDGGDRWATVRELLVRRAAEANAPDLALVVFDATDQRRFIHELGAFRTTQRIAVASASKLVSGLVLFDVIRQGRLSLTSSTGAVLGWTGPKAAITLAHLLSFTSGLEPNAACTRSLGMSLGECVDVIALGAPVAPPGTRFDYGSSHLHVAARMAEIATGRSWEELFDQVLRAPFGFPAELAYYTAPRQSLGQSNPLIAGGLRATVDEYAQILGLVFHEGALGAVRAGTPELFQAQRVEPFPAVVVGNSPFAALSYDYRYGLTAWLECETPATGCAVISSPGAFGFTPWLDRQAGYYAILGMELGNAMVESGVVAFSVNLEQELKPLIRAALQ